MKKVKFTIKREEFVESEKQQEARLDRSMALDQLVKFLPAIFSKLKKDGDYSKYCKNPESELIILDHKSFLKLDNLVYDEYIYQSLVEAEEDDKKGNYYTHEEAMKHLEEHMKKIDAEYKRRPANCIHFIFSKNLYNK